MGINERNLKIGQRIKMRREQLGLTQEELGKKLWLNKSTIQRYEAGKIANIKMPFLHAMAKQLDVSPDWINLDSDEMGTFSWKDEWYNNDEESIFKKFDNIKPVTLKAYPLLGEIACGKPIFADEDKEHCVMADMDIKADFCLTAKGDSMINARINDGDIVFIQETPMVDNGEIAAVIINDEATLKRVYYYSDQNKLILNPENPKHEPLVFMNEELNEIRILGKAVYFMSAL